MTFSVRIIFIQFIYLTVSSTLQLIYLQINILYSTLIFVILILIMQIRKGSRILFIDKEKKINPKPPQDSTPSISLIITKEAMSQSQFNYQYSQFTLDLPIYKQVKQNLKYLYQLYSNMCEYGGLVSVLASNKLKHIIKEMSLKFPQLSNLTFQNVLEHYVKFYLFSFQVVINTGKRIQNQKLMCLAVPKFIEDEELKQCLTNRQNGIKLFEGDIIVLSQLCKHLGLKQQTFSIRSLAQKQGQQNIKVFVQETAYSNSSTEGDVQVTKSKNNKYSQKLNQHNNQLTNYQIGLQRFKNFPNTDVFEQEPSKCKIQTIQASLKDYINYYNLYESSHENNRSIPINDKFHSYYKSTNQQPSRILSAQFDPNDEFFIQEISKKMESTFLCYKQKYDLLSYADEDIPGVTLPIFSFHLHGTWSGGSQQPFGLSKVDINFGPDQTIWYSIPSDHTSKFFASFKTQSSFGTQKIDGEWVEQLDWFIDRKIPIKKVIQKKGDGIIIGSGSLSWFKSVGKSLHISWNIMTKTQKQIVATRNRYNRIREIRLNVSQNLRMKEKQIKIPLKSILLKTLNHEQYSMAKKKEEIASASLSLSSVVIIRQHLKRCYIEQQKCLNQMIVREDLLNIKYKLYHLFDAESFCANCNGQILNYFVNFNGLCCLQCISKHFLIKKTLQLKDKTLYYKYDPYLLYQLIYYGSSRSIVEEQLYFSEFHQLCSGQFILSNSICTKKTQRQTVISVEREQWEIVMKENEQEQSRTKQSQHFSKFLKLFNKKIQNKSGTDIEDDEISKNCCIQTNLSLSTQVTDEQINSYSSSVISNKIQNSYSKTNINMKSNETQYREYSGQVQRRKQRRRYRDDDRSATSGSDDFYSKQRKQRQQRTYKVHFDRDDQKGKYYQKNNYIEKEKRYCKRDLNQQQESQTQSRYQNNRKNEFYRYPKRGSNRLNR